MSKKKINAWTIIKILSWTESYFHKHSIDSPRLTSELLLAYCLGIKRLDLYLQHDRPLSKNELSNFKALIQKRKENQPLAYIIGEKGFYESDFKVTKDVLIPRPDTETIVEQALKILEIDQKNKIQKTVLELGTGSGAIIISLAKKMLAKKMLAKKMLAKKLLAKKLLAKKLPDNFYFASDISFQALAIAKKNSKNIVSNKISFFASNWFSSLKNIPQLDLIISNPPYIPSNDILNLAPEIRKFEPMVALDGGNDGLDCFRAILKDAYNYLVPGGVILFEIGFDQKRGLHDIVNKYVQYKNVKFIKDLAGHNRVAVIRMENH